MSERFNRFFAEMVAERKRLIAMDTLTTDIEELGIEELQFHPKVREKISKELNLCLSLFKKVNPNELMRLQGKVEMLEWVLHMLVEQVYEEEKRSRFK